MSKELYVGSLSYEATEYELEKLFSVSGRVTSIHLITDAKTGQFKGCGYVRMSTEAEAKDAIQSLDGALFLNKTISVSMANPQKQAQQGGYKGKAGGRGGAGGRPDAARRTSASGRPASVKKSPARPASAPSSAKPAASKKRP